MQNNIYAGDVVGIKYDGTVVKIPYGHKYSTKCIKCQKFCKLTTTQFSACCGTSVIGSILFPLGLYMGYNEVLIQGFHDSKIIKVQC